MKLEEIIPVTLCAPTTLILGVCRKVKEFTNSLPAEVATGVSVTVLFLLGFSLSSLPLAIPAGWLAASSVAFLIERKPVLKFLAFTLKDAKTGKPLEEGDPVKFLTRASAHRGCSPDLGRIKFSPRREKWFISCDGETRIISRDHDYRVWKITESEYLARKLHETPT